MKKKVVLFVLFCFVLVQLRAEDDTTLKMAKHAIEIFQITKMVQSNHHVEPSILVYDSITNKLIKAFFVNPMESQKINAYDELEIIWTGNKIKNLVYNKSKVLLEWDNKNRISNFHNTTSSGYNYKIVYDEETNLVKAAIFKGVNPGVFINNYVFWKDGQIVEIDVKKEIDLKLSYFKNTQYNYTPDVFSYTITDYKIRTIKKSPIISTVTKREVVRKDSCWFQYIHNGELKTEWFYDEKRRLIKGIEYNIYGNRYKSWSYLNDSLFRSEELTKKNDSITFHNVRIYFSLPNQDPKRPIYEWKEGSYGFDSKGNLTRESKGVQYRDYINGQWTSWQNYIY